MATIAESQRRPSPDPAALFVAGVTVFETTETHD
jgi:hypothetical protein